MSSLLFLSFHIGSTYWCAIAIIEVWREKVVWCITLPTDVTNSCSSLFLLKVSVRGGKTHYEYFWWPLTIIVNLSTYQTRVLEPKLFIFSYGSTFVHNFVSASPAPATGKYCHFKLFYNSCTILLEVEISFSSS